MTIKKFKDGTVLVTGDDVFEYMMKALNKRNNHEKECSFCAYEDTDSCDDCSMFDKDLSCSCHINPPCSKCVDSRFEVSDYLINYKHFKDGRSPWECYRGDKQTFDKLTEIESQGFYANAETLTTGEITMYISKNGQEEEDIEICRRVEFKSKMSQFINRFDVSLWEAE